MTSRHNKPTTPLDPPPDIGEQLIEGKWEPPDPQLESNTGKIDKELEEETKKAIEDYKIKANKLGDIESGQRGHRTHVSGTQLQVPQFILHYPLGTTKAINQETGKREDIPNDQKATIILDSILKGASICMPKEEGWELWQRVGNKFERIG